MVMAASVNIPATKEYQGTHIVDEPENMAWEVADFLFGVKSMQKIASGNGSWGDALNVGITAATFFIPPAKLLTFGGKALGKVIVDAEKVAANEAVSEIAKKVALRTADEAKSIRDTGLPLAENPIRPMSEARFKKITGPEPKTKFVPEGKPLDKKANEGYTRTADEEYDYFNPKSDVKQEAEDFINAQGPTKKLLTKEELNLKDVNKSQMYDKRELTDEELYQGVETLLKWNKSRNSKDVQEVARSYSAIKKALAFEKKNPGTLNPKDKAYLDIIFPELEKEFRTKVAKTKNGERILAKVDEELPSIPVQDIPDEMVGGLVDPITGVVKQTTPELPADIPAIPRGPMTTSVGAKIPEDLKTIPKIDRAAYLQAEIRKLENFNKANTINSRKASPAKFDDLKTKTAKNKDLIDKYNKQLKDLSKELSQDERATAFKVAAEITKRAIAESKNKSIGGKPNIKRAIPSKITEGN